MQSVVASRAHLSRSVPRFDRAAVSIWALAGGLVLYLAIAGGGYDVVVHSQASIVVWWCVLFGCAWGLLPVRRIGRGGWMALALFGGFVAFTALASTWSASSERSLLSLSLVAGYLGVLVLGLMLAEDRAHSIRHTVGALSTSIAAVTVLALASRLYPDFVPAATETSAFMPGTQGRLAWPLNYWNALAALIILDLPLMLAVATSARSFHTQAAAAGAIPAMILCGYLTFSRGSVIAGFAAIVVFLALTEDRLAKLLTVALTGGASALLIAGAHHRSALEHGLLGAAARSEGRSLTVAIVLVCAGVAFAQVGLGMISRHATRPKALQVPVGRARRLLAVTVMVAIVGALIAGAPNAVSRAWNDFKHPTAAVLNESSPARFGSLSGNQRYDYWKAAIHATPGHLLGGRGPGTFQLTWLPRAPFLSYVENAHSLYVETLSEVGIVGLALLVGFLALAVSAAVRAVVRGHGAQRVQAAAVAAAMVAFCLSGAADWIWQVPALPVAFMCLAAAVLVPARRARQAGSAPGSHARLVLRVGAVGVALGCLLAVAVPLASTTAVRASQSAVTAGDLSSGLAAARRAANLEPGAATPQLQLALVEELRGDLRAALAAARRASGNEPENWATWLIRSRIEAESGKAGASLADYRMARALNPRSPIFHR